MKDYINTNRIRDIRDEASRAAHDIFPDRVSVAISKDVINNISQDSINVIKEHVQMLEKRWHENIELSIICDIALLYLDRTGDMSMNVKVWIQGTDLKYRYMLLDRLKEDCEYYLNGHKSSDSLWGITEKDHIQAMIDIWDSLPANGKPQWLTMQQIEDFAKQMNVDMKGKVNDNEK